MTDKINKRIAEALVECGYADNNWLNSDNSSEWWVCWVAWDNDTIIRNEIVDPFADTLESRRQADALEDWLDNFWSRNLWQASVSAIKKYNSKTIANNHQWRLDRIKWCFEYLEEKDNGHS